MIKAVILDFGGVLFSNKKEFDGPTGDLSNNRELWLEARVGKVNDQVVFEDIAKRFNTDSNTVVNWFYSRREPNSELLGLLDKLKPEVKVCILNNGLRTLFHGLLDKYELNERFDAYINSAEEGVEKPDPKIYRVACERLGIEPSDCVFIDDDGGNLEGAKAVGMQVIEMKDPHELKEHFKELGLV